MKGPVMSKHLALEMLDFVAREDLWVCLIGAMFKGRGTGTEEIDNYHEKLNGT